MPPSSISFALQAVVALGLLNVWLVRAGRSTSYRGGQARTLEEEFAAYGLPRWFFHLVGTLKIGCAIALLIGMGVPVLVKPAAAIVVVLMLGALSMHVKVKDPPKKSLPAALMLVMSAAIVLL